MSPRTPMLPQTAESLLLRLFYEQISLRMVACRPYPPKYQGTTSDGRTEDISQASVIALASRGFVSSRGAPPTPNWEVIEYFLTQSGHDAATAITKQRGDHDVDLFTALQPPMVRTPDMPASVKAAHKVGDARSDLHQELLKTIGWMQPVTAIELEELDPFRKKYAPSTVRKRVSELAAAGLIVAGETQQYTTLNGRATEGTGWKIP